MSAYLRIDWQQRPENLLRIYDLLAGLDLYLFVPAAGDKAASTLSFGAPLDEWLRQISTNQTFQLKSYLDFEADDADQLDEELFKERLQEMTLEFTCRISKSHPHDDHHRIGGWWDDNQKFKIHECTMDVDGQLMLHLWQVQHCLDDHSLPQVLKILTKLETHLLA